jgi:hypothetical protein
MIINEGFEISAMENCMNHETSWLEELYSDEGRVFSRIMWELKDVNYYTDADQIVIFEFLKDRLVEFDVFYQEYKEILISLAD